MESSLPKTFKAIFSNGDGKDAYIKEIPLEMPGKNQVLIKVDSVPINPSDLGTIIGVYSVFPDEKALPQNTERRIGLEGSGTIVAVGEDLKVKHEKGSQVSFFQLGSWAEYVLVNSEDVCPIKKGLSLEQGASAFINPATVVFMYRTAQQGGHKAMIQDAATSSLGKMMIRYFKQNGKKSINIVRRDDAIEELKKEGADYVFNQNDPDFESKLKEAANKLEATIAFDAIAGEMAGKILRNMPAHSELYIYGFRDQSPVGGASFADFLLHDKVMKGLWLTRYYYTLSPEERQKLWQEAQQNLDGTLRSEIIKTFKMEEFAEAIKFYDKNSSKGKVLLKMS